MPILIFKEMRNVCKIIKPTHAIVYAGKENLFKYRNKIYDENNSQTFFKENNSIESIIKNSEVFMQRKKNETPINVLLMTL